jgi:hypothetical protein
MKRCLILVEGQTEERFVKDVLAPHLATSSVHSTPVVLITKVVINGTNFKGGVTNYNKFRSDLVRLIGDTDAYVTSLIDYYGLPEDCPGMSDRPVGIASVGVKYVEDAILEDLNNPQNFLPFLLLHEFEALLFTDPYETAKASLSSDKGSELAASAGSLTPEEINEHKLTAPSKRILSVLPHFRKTLHGPTAAKRIGLARIREKCPHFDSWLTLLEGIGVT